jgi:hypothetical protein
MIRRVLGAGLRITMSEVRVGVPLAYTSSSSSMIPECKCSQNGSRRRTHRTMYERNTAASPLERAGVRLEYAEERHGRASYAMRVGPFRELKGAGWGASPLLFKKELNNDPPSPRGRQRITMSAFASLILQFSNFFNLLSTRCPRSPDKAAYHHRQKE